ncbi:uncharacterized protein PSFLO_03598 [Pseudozyma flocculosa]|uniref:Uncharacterized protein n=1 Tax=Pseudozyma flocculosa TaxID=84751 RepID=A0A5C3F4H1_9BASI|nr:uncharacterized protein PSFLO_03598 [Pseudozyma flocculosa]
MASRGSLADPGSRSAAQRTVTYGDQSQRRRSCATCKAECPGREILCRELRLLAPVRHLDSSTGVLHSTKHAENGAVSSHQASEKIDGEATSEGSTDRRSEPKAGFSGTDGPLKLDGTTTWTSSKRSDSGCRSRAKRGDQARPPGNGRAGTAQVSAMVLTFWVMSTIPGAAASFRCCAHTRIGVSVLEEIHPCTTAGTVVSACRTPEVEAASAALLSDPPTAYSSVQPKKVRGARVRHRCGGYVLLSSSARGKALVEDGDASWVHYSALRASSPAPKRDRDSANVARAGALS